MDSILAQLEGLAAPPSPSPRILGNAIAVSPKGDIAVLSNHSLLFSSREPLGGSGYGPLQPVRLTADLANLAEYSSILFLSAYNENKLLLWGDRAIAIATLNIRTMETPLLALTPLGRDALSTGTQIAQVSPHPYSTDHILALLTNGPLLLLSIDNTIAIPLNIAYTYSSFSYGHEIGWLRWSLFIVASDGHIDVLCPIIPSGIHITSDMKIELITWRDDHSILPGMKQESSVEFIQSLDDFIDHFEHDTFTSTPVNYSPPSVRALTTVIPLKFTNVACVYSNGVPVLVGVSEGGEVSVLIITEDAGPYWGKSTASSYQHNVPWEALVVHTLCVRESLPSSCPSSVVAHVTQDKLWEVTTDPLLAHVLHVVGRTCGCVFMVSIPWLDASSSSSVSSSALQSKDANRLDCVPVYAPSVCGPLAAHVVISDPFLGHLSLFWSGTGGTALVNLTVHTRLCALERRLADGKSQLGRVGASVDGHYDALDHVTDRLIAGVLRDVNDTPMPEQIEEEDGGVGALTQAMEYLDRAAIGVLEEVAQRLSFRLDLTKDLALTQSQLLGEFQEGGDRGGEMQGEEREGFSATLAAVRSRQEKGAARLMAIKDSFDRQRELVACVLSQALMLKSKVSVEESKFYDELQELKGLVEGAERVVDSLRAQARTLRMHSSVKPKILHGSPYAHLLVSPEHSPVKQVEWFSRRRIGATTEKASLLLSTPTHTPSKTPQRTPSQSKQSSAELNSEELQAINKQLAVQASLIAATSQAFVTLQETMDNR